MDLILPKIKGLEDKYKSMINVPEDNKDLSYIRKIVGYTGGYKGRVLNETTKEEWDLLKNNLGVSLSTLALKVGHSREWVSRRLELLNKGYDNMKENMKSVELIFVNNLDGKDGWSYSVDKADPKKVYQSKSKAIELATKFIKKTYFDGLRLSTRTFGSYNIKIMPGHSREGKYVVNGSKKYSNLLDAYNYVYGKVTGNVVNNTVDNDIKHSIDNDIKNESNHSVFSFDKSYTKGDSLKKEKSVNHGLDDAYLIKLGILKSIEDIINSNASADTKLHHIKEFF